MRRILVDETSARRGHRCVTSVVDANTRELFLMAEGRGGETIAAFVAELRAPGGESAQIELVCIDLSAAYREGVRLNLPNARIVFDRITSCSRRARHRTPCARAAARGKRSHGRALSPAGRRLEPH